MRVLVVDRDPLLRNAWKRLLAERGYDVVASDGDEDDIAQYHGRVPDLVLLDLDAARPVNQGLPAIEHIRDAMPNARILVLSSWLNRRKALESGADVYLSKPLDYAAALKMVDMMTARPPSAEYPVSNSVALTTREWFA